MPRPAALRWGVLWLVSLLLLTLHRPGPAQAAPLPQPQTPEERAQALLAEMSPAQRVGQLFLIGVTELDLTEGSPLYDLIAKRHIGGVVLLNIGDSLRDPTNPAPEVLAFTRQAQEVAWRAQITSRRDPFTGATYKPRFVPLFIGLAQDGDGYPTDTLPLGLTPLPSPLALGATWSPDLVQATGAVLGRELSTLGINLLLGPPLDVLETPRPGSPGDLNVRSFGGDPYWVGLLGQAFIRGVHLGSEGHIAVVAKHFPGYGASDRDPTQEVATVRKSLEQLKQIELAPFFAVTGNAPDAGATADALLASPLRYQGFQGNIRATTRPISLDPQAYAQLMDLAPLAVWRAAGGLLVSDDLGSHALRRFYDPTGSTYNARQVAREAFLAGNDLLFLGQVTEPGDDTPYPAIERVLAFFLQRYYDDPVFAQRVDEAVLRILTLKARLYPVFALDTVRAQPEGWDTLGNAENIPFQVAQAAATLISPAPIDLEGVLPRPPGPNDRLLFIGDSLPYRPCTSCPIHWTPGVDALAQAVLRLYSVRAGGPISPDHVATLSYADLAAWLQTPQDFPETGQLLRKSNWLIVASLDISPQRPTSTAFRDLLNRRSDLLRNKNIVVFALQAPYYFDATDLSKISAYYGLYSKTPAFIEVAARLLFRELQPQGSPPVSIEGVGYDLITATAPDPEQTIPLTWDFPPPASALEAVTPAPDQPFTVSVGSVVPVRTGVILDHNGHPVPDGTVVQFLLTGPGGEPVQQQVTVTTRGGVARASLQIALPGLWEVHARSEPATQSTTLLIQAQEEEETALPLTVTVTVVSSPQPTATPSPSPTPPVPQPTPPAEIRAKPTHLRTDWLDYLVALGLSSFAAMWTYFTASGRGYVRWGTRWGLLLFTGGMTGYLYAALSLPGARQALQRWGHLAPFGFTAFGLLLGAVFGWGWWWYQRQHTNTTPPKARTSSGPSPS